MFVLGVDVETTGLDPSKGALLELYAEVLNLKVDEDGLVEVVDEFHAIMRPPNAVMKHVRQNEYIMNMHTENGLWDDIQEHGEYIRDVEERFLEWLKSHGAHAKDNPVILLGSSVGFDAKWLRKAMPWASKLFHYRIIDVTSITLSAQAQGRITAEEVKALYAQYKTHRAKSDLDGTIALYEEVERRNTGR